MDAALTHPHEPDACGRVATGSSLHMRRMNTMPPSDTDSECSLLPEGHASSGGSSSSSSSSKQQQQAASSSQRRRHMHVF